MTLLTVTCPTHGQVNIPVNIEPGAAKGTFRNSSATCSAGGEEIAIPDGVYSIGALGQTVREDLPAE